MQSGEDPAGGKDGKSAKPLPWKYIIIAAIVAAAILVIFFAATSGIFSGPASVADTTTTTSSVSTGSGFSPPATENSGSLAVTDKEDNKKSTKATRIPTADQITSRGTLIDISNPPEYLKMDHAQPPKNPLITDIEINNDKITAAFLGVDKTQSHRIELIRIIFFNTEQNRISRKQQRCRYYDFEYKMGDAYCQWPEDYCGLTWEKYWENQGRTTKSITEDIVPVINAGEKYTFSINNCPIPIGTKYVLITTTA